MADGRIASCSCRALSLECQGDPVRISVCHCLACQRRTGSAFGVAAFFRDADVTIAGESNTWVRIGDSGSFATFHSCPVCAATVYWIPEFRPGHVAIAVGAFADPAFPAPTKQVYGEMRHPWVAVAGVVED